MIERSIERLAALCETIPPLLHQIDDAEFSRKPATGKWSRKEIIGHLIDSATNNHHRLVRGQFEDVPYISYEPDAWNACGHYINMDGRQIISFWEAYNRQILSLIRIIPKERLSREVSTGDEKPHSLEFLISDYIAHLEHHLRQVVVDYSFPPVISPI